MGVVDIVDIYIDNIDRTGESTRGLRRKLRASMSNGAGNKINRPLLIMSTNLLQRNSACWLADW
jgi:hypothetical protein